MKKFFIATAIAYANAGPHVGHALEFIHADAVARFRREAGDDVHFLTGTDEHGVKIVKTAEAAGKTPRELVDENSAKFRELREKFNLSWDDFIRTSDRERHFPACQKLWQRLVENGDLYEKEYEGRYCYGCEEFKRDADLVDGKCPNHDREPEVVKEKNWFFRLSKYSDKILELLESREVAIVPEFRAKEIINVVRDGLHDVSFSRPTESLKGWGIPIPGDDLQLMYVWCDALTNYISALGYGSADESQFEKYFPTDVHAIGKDIVRFHAGIWIGMLLAADLPLPKQIYVHGFVTSEGQKMSKSIGNVVDPLAIADEFGVDALRYYLLAEIPNGQDGDFSAERFRQRYESELANGLGNLLSRTVTMALKLGEKFEIAGVDETATQKIDEMKSKISAAMREHDCREALAAIFEVVDFANVFIAEKQPWKMDDPRKVLATALAAIHEIAKSLTPFLPTTSAKILDSLGVDESGKIFSLTKPEILFPKK